MGNARVKIILLFCLIIIITIMFFVYLHKSANRPAGENFFVRVLSFDYMMLRHTNNKEEINRPHWVLSVVARNDVVSCPGVSG